MYDDIEVPYLTKYYNDTLVCYSYSKSLSLPGERIGYIVIAAFRDPVGADDVHDAGGQTPEIIDGLLRGGLIGRACAVQHATDDFFVESAPVPDGQGDILVGGAADIVKPEMPGAHGGADQILLGHEGHTMFVERLLRPGILSTGPFQEKPGLRVDGLQP